MTEEQYEEYKNKYGENVIEPNKDEIKNYLDRIGARTPEELEQMKKDNMKKCEKAFRYVMDFMDEATMKSIVRRRNERGSIIMSGITDDLEIWNKGPKGVTIENK